MEVERKLHIQRNLMPLLRRCIRQNKIQQIIAGIAKQTGEKQILDESSISSLDEKETACEKAFSLFQLLANCKSDKFARFLEITASHATDIDGILKSYSKMYHNIGDLPQAGYFGSAELGHSTGSKMYLGTDNSRNVAVKILTCPRETDPTEIFNEIKNLIEKHLNHRNIVSYLSTSVNAENDNLYLTMELGFCNLQDIVDMDLILCNEENILKQSSDGLSFLHQNNIIHKALKPTNVILTMDKHIKLTDYHYWSSAHIETSHRSSSIATRGWLPPEILEYLQSPRKNPIKWDKKGDIFSLGCIFFFVLTRGKHPFGVPADTEYNIRNNKLNELNFMELISKELQKDVITKMISHDPEKRRTISEIVNMDIFPHESTEYRDIFDLGILTTDEKDKLDKKEMLRKKISSKVCSEKCIVYNTSNFIRNGVGNVFQGTYGDMSVAVKVLRNFGNDKASINEIEQLLKGTSEKHQNVVGYYHAELRDEGHILLALEFCDATLDEWLDDHTRLSPASTSKRKLLKDITNGFAFLHSKSIIHRDVKPSNVLLKSISNDIVAKISDFGISRDLQGKTSKTVNTNSGTDGWRAPEIIRAGQSGTAASLHQSTKTDIFPLGCLFIYVLNNRTHPYDKSEQNILNQRLTLVETNASLDVRANWNFLMKMLSPDPDNRPTAVEILKHPIVWSNARSLAFLVEVSNFVEGVYGCILKNRRFVLGKKSKKKKTCIQELERTYGANISAGSANEWFDATCSTVKLYLMHDSINKNYQKHATGLIRVIRNLKGHFEPVESHRNPTCKSPPSLPSLPSIFDIKKKIGDPPDKYWEYWKSRFPALLDKTYNAFEPCKEYDQLNGYYELN